MERDQTDTPPAAGDGARGLADKGEEDSPSVRSLQESLAPGHVPLPSGSRLVSHFLSEPCLRPRQLFREATLI
ncbi:hypothetical protein KGM_214764 [Danaus plexippus plexippus]|uniref:Uncharacterized protein n=1 Tax=Danaus plexippus plexippus TaxID=278856 RepID=A0A212EVY1_DANPL|nr:hypothetical protein KGM_214764 [Danaus plexippus plexippus]